MVPILGWGRILEEGRQTPFLYSCLTFRQKSLAGYGPQDRTELDPTEVTAHSTHQLLYKSPGLFDEFLLPVKHQQLEEAGVKVTHHPGLPRGEVFFGHRIWQYLNGQVLGKSGPVCHRCWGDLLRFYHRWHTMELSRGVAWKVKAGNLRISASPT